MQASPRLLGPYFLTKTVLASNSLKSLIGAFYHPFGINSRTISQSCTSNSKSLIPASAQATSTRESQFKLLSCSKSPLPPFTLHHPRASILWNSIRTSSRLSSFCKKWLSRATAACPPRSLHNAPPRLKKSKPTAEEETGTNAADKGSKRCVRGGGPSSSPPLSSSRRDDPPPRQSWHAISFIFSRPRSLSLSLSRPPPPFLPPTPLSPLSPQL